MPLDSTAPRDSTAESENVTSPTFTVQLNHTIVGCHDKQATAEFWADILGLRFGKPFSVFQPLEADNGIGLDLANVPEGAEIAPQHYAFLVSEEQFDIGFGKIQQYGLTYWPDPRQSRENEINHNDGGRGVYFLDPNGHFMEMITVPYGGWPS
nr:VOC family protein [Stackebrandtia endophytica]